MPVDIIAQNDFRALADETGLTQGAGGNTGGASGTFFNTVSTNAGTIVADAAYQVGAAIMARVTQNTGILHFSWTALPATSDLCLQLTTRWNQAPATADTVFVRAYGDAAQTTQCFSLAVSRLNELMVLGSTAAMIHRSTELIPTGTVVRWIVEAIAGASIRVRAINTVTGAQILDTGVVANAAAPSVMSLRFGTLTGTSGIGPLWIGRITAGTPAAGSAWPHFLQTAPTVPWGVVSPTGWQAGGTATSVPDGIAAVDGGWAQTTAQNPSGIVLEARLTDGLARPQTVEVDVWLSEAGSVPCRLELLCGATVLDTATVTVTSTVSAPGTVGLDITEAMVPTITDWGDLRVRITAGV